MTTTIPCPKCGKYKLERSHSKNGYEKVVKTLLPIRVYRCHQCNWRGWMKKQRKNGNGSLFKSLLFYIAVILLSYLAAYWLWSRIR